MKYAISISLLVLLILPTIASGQDVAKPLPNAPSSLTTAEGSGDISKIGQRAADPPSSPVAIDPVPVQPAPATGVGFGVGDKFRYYVTETYFNPSALTAPAFRAGLRMANPPGKGASRYPLEWRQGANAFGRNYGDAFAERVSFQTARFVTGAITREDPRYIPSSSHNILARSVHALSFSFVDRSDSGRPMPALSNFVGAAAAGFVGNAYLPAGFNDVTHAGQRAMLRFGFSAAGNLFREFTPQMPRPMRTFFMLIAR
jgi:hypothetical protein